LFFFSDTTPSDGGVPKTSSLDTVRFPGWKYFVRMEDIETSIETASQIEIQRMEGNLGYLGVIAGIAPMLGFVGTISGIIRIFYDISVSNDFNISTIASGMYEKMITSGSGLIIGLLAYAGYHLLNMKIDRFALRIQMAASDFLDVLQKPVSSK